MFHMERRQEPRFRVAQPMHVTVLDPSHQEIPASIVDISAGGLSLRLSKPIRAGTLVKVETSEILLLGEICHCAADEDGFRVGFVVQHRLALEARQEQLVSVHT